jgi:pimeloyl-ACP methyl ester carboxylesterase
LHIARVPAINRRKQADPLFVLAGGPGMGAGAFYASIAPAFERIHRDRDIVLVDQRGTGSSNPLNCALDDNELYRAADSEIGNEARRCLAALATKADVTFYTTSIAVRDLDQVRAALGYDRINLYGASYGTRVAQHYARRFPSRTRSMILDGVVPPQLALGPGIALDAEAALTRILTRCTHEPDCHTKFADPEALYLRLRGSLRTHPVSVSIADPTTGQPLKFEFTSYHLATVLRLASYASEQAALLPLSLHEAVETGNFAPLAGQFLLVNRSYGDAVAYGMHNSVVCSEDVPFYDWASVNRDELEKTYLGTTQLDGLRNICAAWPHGPVDSDFHEPLKTDSPVLLLSGSDDPVTPPAQADQARRAFTHNLHVVLKGFGHGQLTAPCVDRLMARFINLGLDGLDVTCTREDKPLPFFTSLSGPQP